MYAHPRIRALSLLAALLLTPALPAQSGSLRWRLDVEQAIAEARQTRRPLMFWVVGRSGDREESVERDQKRAFRDPAVIDAARRFIPVQLSRSVYREQLEKWQLPPRTNLEIVFATPEGEKIDSLAPSGVGHPESFRQKMNLVYAQYRARLFQNEIRPQLSADAPQPADVQKALQLIESFGIREADQTLVQLAQREGLDAALRKKILDVLAALSTNAAANALYDWAVAGDADAAAALGNCTPPVAERLLPKLGGENLAEHVFVYNVVTRICKIKGAKPDRFWEGTNEKIKHDEIERVKRLVEKAARDWRKRHDDD